MVLLKSYFVNTHCKYDFDGLYFLERKYGKNNSVKCTFHMRRDTFNVRGYT